MVDISFEQNSRRKHELKMRPAIDSIYARVWPGCTIERFERSEDVILDIKFAIDVKITLPNGMILTGQEKALTYPNRRYRTVTVEYWNDPETKQNPGDWFHLASQFYFCGYSTQAGDGFDPWVILDWAQIVEATRRGRIIWKTQGNNHSNARANFKNTPMEDLPRRAIMYSYGLVFPSLYAKTDWWTPRQMSLMPELRQYTLAEAIKQPPVQDAPKQLALMPDDVPAQSGKQNAQQGSERSNVSPT